MIQKIIILIAVILIVECQPLKAQNNRIQTQNTIGWYNYFGTFKISKKTGIHTEYQWRRNNVVSSWQQSLLRVGINYNANARVQMRLGYALIETYPYGDIPLNSFGKNFTEHRIFEALLLNHKEGIVDIAHRFMLEQRFIGKYSSASLAAEDSYPLLHRWRYMLRCQVPLNGKEIKDKTAYVAFYNEICIGFGKNVNANIFDQNRIGLLLGYRFSKNVRLEAGYLNQTLQLGRQINNKNIFQNNNGVIINANFNVDLTKK